MRIALLKLMGICSLTFSGLSSGDEPVLNINPSQVSLSSDLARVQVQVTRQVGRNSLDATHSAQYEISDPTIAEVSQSGVVRPKSNGTASLRIKDGTHVATIPVVVAGMSKSTISFRQHVMPALSKAGCNGGSCHAAQYGQGGFKLSLFGFDPLADYPQLARDLMGRRISRVRPDDSLIVRKPLLDVPHEGGKRFDAGSYEHEIFMQWVEAGLPGPVSEDKETRIVGLDVFPRERTFDNGESQQMRVVAQFSDGTTRDVTALAKYDSMGDGVALVDKKGLISSVGPGQAAIMIRYEGQAEVSMVLVPYEKAVSLESFIPNNFVDELVANRLNRLGLRPVGLSSDEEFLRRVFLDALGTLPNPELIAEFLASDASHKRADMIDAILGLTGDPKKDIYGDEWSGYWSLKWSDLLRNNRNVVGDGGMWSFHNWIRQSLRENKPVDAFVREIITAQGSIFENGPANFYRIAKNPEQLAETTAQVFLGVRLQCAKCHHHPFEVYSQGDYYGLAAFFTRVGTKSSTDFGALGGESVVLVKSSGQIKHPRTRKVMQPTPLLGEPMGDSAVRDPRRLLATWLTSPDNELFARNIVNRFWGYFMGTGLVESIDDLRATNPPSNPELMQKLAKQFVEDGYDLKKLMRVIMNSRVYQLSSTPPETNPNDTRFYTHYNVKRLPAEVLLDAINYATGTQEKFSGIPLGTRAIELPDPNYASYFLDTLGRPQRVIACECERTAEPNLAQILHIANGELINRKLADKRGRISQLLDKPPEESIRELYLVTVSRNPSPDELETCHTVISEASNLREGLEDILWAICNSREFLFNH